MTSIDLPTSRSKKVLFFFSNLQIWSVDRIHISLFGKNAEKFLNEWLVLHVLCQSRWTTIADSFQTINTHLDFEFYPGCRFYGYNRILIPSRMDRFPIVRYPKKIDGIYLNITATLKRLIVFSKYIGILDINTPTKVCV